MLTDDARASDDLDDVSALPDLDDWSHADDWPTDEDDTDLADDRLLLHRRGLVDGLHWLDDDLDDE